MVYGNANACIATPLDHNFSFRMVVARLQTKRTIFGLKLAGGLALGYTQRCSYTQWASAHPMARTNLWWSIKHVWSSHRSCYSYTERGTKGCLCSLCCSLPVLCLQDCAKQCACIRDALRLGNELCTLIRASPKRLALFRHLRDQLSPGSPGLKPICPTRWTVRTASIDAILKNCNVKFQQMSVQQ